jgi:hypothetical protein
MDGFKDFPYIPPAWAINAPANGLYADWFFGVFGVIAVVWLAWFIWRKRDWTPLVLVLGGALVVAYEPIVDVLGQIVYPLNYTYYFVSFGRALPMWLFVPYGIVLGIFPYFIARYMEHNPQPKRLYLIAVAMFAGVFALDFVVAGTGHYTYYGTGILRTMCGSIEIAAYPLVSGYLLLQLNRFRQRGWADKVFVKAGIFFTPSIAFAAAFAATCFPLAFALNTPLPLVLDVALRLATIAQTVIVVRLITSMVCADDTRSGAALVDAAAA